MNKVMKKQIDLLVSSFDEMTEKGKEKVSNIVAAFPVKDEDMIHEFIEALMKLSSFGYLEWEETKQRLEDRKDEIKSFLYGKTKEFVFENKTYSLISVPFEEAEEDEKNNSDKYPFVYVKFKQDEMVPEIAYESLEKGREISSLCVPVVKKGTWPGLALGISMPFTVKDKMLYMFDKEGNPCGDPIESAFPLIGGYYLVHVLDTDTFIVNREGIKVSEVGVYVYGPSNGYCVFEKDGKYGFITEWGEICEPKFDEIDVIDIGGPVKVKSGRQWGYVTTDNEFVTEEQQEEEGYDIYCGADF